MECTNCHANIGSWLAKYRRMAKVRLDEQYFREEKLPYRYDESGPYIEGEKFYAHEVQRVFDRCPKCGTKNSVEGDIMWAPV